MEPSSSSVILEPSSSSFELMEPSSSSVITEPSSSTLNNYLRTPSSSVISNNLNSPSDGKDFSQIDNNNLDRESKLTNTTSTLNTSLSPLPKEI